MNSRSKLNNLIGLSAGRITNLVNAKAAYYPGFIRVFVPNIPYLVDDPGYELSIKKERSDKESTSTTYETDSERSIRRTRKLIKDYVLCNPFNQFVTFTFAENRHDVDACKKRMSNWLKNQRNRKGKFRYLIVPEFHKDKKAIHFHALFEGYKGTVKESINSKTGTYFPKPKYHIPGYTLGFSDVKKIDDKTDSATKVSYYIQKYITKDMPLFSNKNRYWISNNLLKPVIENNPQRWYEHIEADRTYPVDHGIFLEFDIGKNAIVDSFIEAKR